MSTSLFSFSVLADGYKERLGYGIVEATAESGRTKRRATFAGERRFEVPSATLLFPNASALTFADFRDFWNARQGGYDSFLYKAKYPEHYAIDAEAVGTSTGAPSETFAATRKFLDAATLVVKVAGVTQTLTTDYTFSGNNTAPTITTTATFDAGAVTLTYEYYYQVLFAADPYEPETLVPGASLASPGTKRVRIALLEEVAGGHLV